MPSRHPHLRRAGLAALRPWRAALCVGAVVAGAIVAGCATPAAPLQPAMQRDTTAGPMVGVDDAAASGTWQWKGVPFAQPPVGDLRWRAPQDPTPSTQPKATRAFAPACVQTGRLYGPGLNNRHDQTIGSTLGTTVGSEDCLYLNIWTPSTRPTAPRPVIVFVHGGSNITGYTADPVYDGAALARHQDVVVVSVNYRLGIFGFLDLAPLKTGRPDEDSGNFALLDIAKALEFVAANIGAFGGDAARVTLMGQSAGAVNVYGLLSSPLLLARTQPLFHRVVALSGGISAAATLPKGAIAGVLPRSVWQARGQALMLESLVAGGRAIDEAGARRLSHELPATDLAAWLRSQPPDALLQVVRTRLAARGMAASNPIPDGWVVADSPIEAIRAGRYRHLPVLAGHTRDEAKLFPQLFALRPELGGISGRLLDDAAVFALVSGYDAQAAPQTRIEAWVPAAYLPASAPHTGFDARAAALDRLWFSAIRDDVLDALRSRQDRVWAYEFEWDEQPPPFDQLFGAAHTFDLPFVFGNFGPSLYSRVLFTEHNRPGRHMLSARMQAALGAFARDGDPNDVSLGLTWPIWPRRLVVDADAHAARLGVR